MTGTAGMAVGVLHLCGPARCTEVEARSVAVDLGMQLVVVDE